MGNNTVNLPEDVARELMQHRGILQSARPAMELTIEEVEKLAKAGVAVDLKDVTLTYRDPPYFHENKLLMDPLVHRMRTAFPINDYRHDRRFRFMSAALTGAGVEGGENHKVALFLVTVHGNAALLEDDLKMWPSDALIAKIHLLLETEEKSKRPMNLNASAGNASAGAQQAPASLQGMLARAIGKV